MLTPNDITNKKFTTSHLKSGYVQDEVDEFLDEVRDAYEGALGDLARHREALDRYRNASAAAETTAIPTVTVAAPRPAPASDFDAMALLLENAQRTAEQLTNEAAVKAATKAHDAEAEASTVKAAAQVEAQRIVGEAQAEADRLGREAETARHAAVGALELQRAELEKKVAALTLARTEAAGYLRAALEGLAEAPHE